VLPIIRPFDKPFEVWSKRDATSEELACMPDGAFSPVVNGKLTARIANEYQAAEYMARHGTAIALERHIDGVLRGAPFKQWLKAMPDATPLALEAYQQDYPPQDYGPVDDAIRAHGIALSPGQMLFHGGHIGLKLDDEFVTTRPLSATFCPQVALRSAEWRGKAYEAGQVCLYLLRVISQDTKAFVFDPDASDKGNEKEVLLASGARLIQRQKNEVRRGYNVSRFNTDKMDSESRLVPVYLCVVDVC
jgi:hypothetical protein